MEVLSKYRAQIREAQTKEKNNIELGFNFFTSISDYYYRENFHSDIFKTLLSIPEFFDTFFKELSKHLGFYINFDFNSTIVEREKHGRIDISVIDSYKKQAIIIENKINDAVDMQRQLPRYFESINNKGIEVINIIYLSISGNKTPSKADWNIDDETNLKNKITIMAGIERDNFLSIESIIKKSIIHTCNIDHIVFQKQYKNLLNKLGAQEINHYVMDELYSKVKSKSDLDELLTLKKLTDELPKYRAVKIREHFKNDSNPFAEVQIWKEYTTFFNKLIFKESNFALDIDCYETYYDVSFFDRNAETIETALNFIEKTNLGLTQRVGSSRLFKSFQYPEQEKDLYQFIKTVKTEIEKNCH